MTTSRATRAKLSYNSRDHFMQFHPRHTTTNMSFRPFGELPSTGLLGAGGRYTLFSGVLLVQVFALIGAAYLFLRSARAHKKDQERPQRLMIVCGVTLLGVTIGLIDVETAIYFLPKGQTNWSITLGFVGLAISTFLFLPTSMIHAEDREGRKGTSIPLIIVSVALLVVGVSLTALFWFHPEPIWGVRLTSFIWNGLSLVVVSGVSIYAGRLRAGKNRDSLPAVRIALTIASLAITVAFNSVESPLPLLMRFFEMLGFIGVGAIAFWTSLALDTLADKDSLPHRREAHTTEVKPLIF